MTRDEILAMEPGRELDALVETVVMKRFASTGEHGGLDLSSSPISECRSCMGSG